MCRCNFHNQSVDNIIINVFRTPKELYLQGKCYSLVLAQLRMDEKLAQFAVGQHSAAPAGPTREPACFHPRGSVSRSIVCLNRWIGTILACKFSKSSRELARDTVMLPQAPHCTTHCPQCLVCVVGALNRFLTCNAVNGAREKQRFRLPIELPK